MKLFPAFCVYFLTVFSLASGFDENDWSVRCWNSETRLWEAQNLTGVTISEENDSTKVTNSTGIHRHAHFTFPAELNGDFCFTIELRGGYELGFLNRAGKDEMLYLELDEQKDFETFELSRRGTRFSIKRNGRERPLVHFRFDYGDDILITLAIKDGESAWIRSYTFRDLSKTIGEHTVDSSPILVLAHGGGYPDDRNNDAPRIRWRIYNWL